MKTYLIIGGTSGIGLEVTKKLSKIGHHIYVFSRNNRNLDALPNVVFHEIDVTSENNTYPEIEQIDGVVYTPGSLNLKPIRNVSTDDIQNDFSTNVIGIIKIIQQYYKQIRKSGSSIVLFSSVVAKIGMPFHTSIAISKGAIEALTKTLAAELSPKVRVNAIAPSTTNTPLTSTILSNELAIKQASSRHPLSNIGDPKDISELVIYLLSDSSKFMTGQIIGIDGGMSSVKLFKG